MTCTIQNLFSKFVSLYNSQCGDSIIQNILLKVDPHTWTPFIVSYWVHILLIHIHKINGEYTIINFTINTNMSEPIKPFSIVFQSINPYNNFYKLILKVCPIICRLFSKNVLITMNVLITLYCRLMTLLIVSQQVHK